MYHADKDYKTICQALRAMRAVMVKGKQQGTVVNLTRSDNPSEMLQDSIHEVRKEPRTFKVPQPSLINVIVHFQPVCIKHSKYVI